MRRKRPLSLKLSLSFEMIPMGDTALFSATNNTSPPVQEFEAVPGSVASDVRALCVQHAAQRGLDPQTVLPNFVVRKGEEKLKGV